MSMIFGMMATIGGAAIGAISANKMKREAERKEAIASQELGRLKEAYSSLDTSNPYTDLENTMEDLTINQRQFEFCLLYTSPSPRDRQKSRMPSSA